MTVLKAFAVLDMAAGAYMAPFFLPTPGMAIRSFADACRDKESPFARHPEDFTLYEVGSFDQASGELARTTNHPLAKAADHVPAGLFDPDQRELGLPGSIEVPERNGGEGG